MYISAERGWKIKIKVLIVKSVIFERIVNVESLCVSGKGEANGGGECTPIIKGVVFEQIYDVEGVGYASSHVRY